MNLGISFKNKLHFNPLDTYFLIMYTQIKLHTVC